MSRSGIHREKGKSQIKEATAEEKEKQRVADKEERAAKKAAKQLRMDEVKDYLTGKWTPKDVQAIIPTAVRLPADANRAVGRALELEPPRSEYFNGPDWYKAIDDWIETLPETRRPYAPILVLAAYAYIEWFGGGADWKEFFNGT